MENNTLLSQELEEMRSQVAILKSKLDLTTAYWSPAFGQFGDELVFDKSDDNTDGFQKMRDSSFGTFLPMATTHYSPYRDTGCATNHMVQKNNTVVYKTANAVEESVPKIRKGTITLSATEQNVTFNDMATTNYIVMTNPPVSDLEVTNKTATGFTVKSASVSSSVMWVAIG